MHFILLSFVALACLPSILATRFNFKASRVFHPLSRTIERRAGSSDTPTCMYNWNNDGSCPEENWGSPNASYCSQSIVSVCLAVSKLPANNNSGYGFQTGSRQIDGIGADCYAAANNGEKAPPLDYNICLQQLTSLIACGTNTGNSGYLPACTGGTINAKYNDNEGHESQPLNVNLPRYGLGTPKFFGVDASKQSFNHPDGQPEADRSNQAAQIAQQQTQEAASSPATAAEESAEEGGGGSRVYTGGYGAITDGE